MLIKKYFQIFYKKSALTVRALWSQFICSLLLNISFLTAWREFFCFSCKSCSCRIWFFILFHFEELNFPQNCSYVMFCAVRQAVRTARFSSQPPSGCTQKTDKTTRLLHCITYQWVELYLITSSTTIIGLWGSPTRSAHDSGALEISNCRLVSSCIGIWFKHWLAPYYMNSNTVQRPLLPQLHVNTIRRLSFTRRYMKSCKQEKFQNW